MSDHHHRPRSWVSFTNERLIHNQRLRLAIVNMVVLALIWSVLSLFVYVVLRHETKTGIDVRLEQYAFRVITEQMLFPNTMPIPSDSQGGDDVSYTVWLMWQGHVKWLEGSSLSQNLLNRMAYLATNEPGASVFFDAKQGDTDYRIYQQPVSLLNQNLIVQTATDIGPEMEVLERLLLLFGFAGLVGIVLTMVGGYTLGLWTLRPLIKARQREKDFLADVSHELRTPLSVMQTNLELMLRHVDDTSEESLEWVEPLYKEMTRMRKMVDDLMDMAKIDAGMAGANFAVFSLSDVCDQVAKLYAPVFAERGIAFHSEIADGLDMAGDGTRIRQLLFILLDNANKYTLEGEVALSLSKKGGAIEIRVRDTGIGIPAAMLHRVTDRFFRADAARTQNSGDGREAQRSKNSSGLGLAIAKRIVESHQGKLIISSVERVGTDIWIRFSKKEKIQKRVPM